MNMLSLVLLLSSLTLKTIQDPIEHLIESDVLGYSLRYWVHVPNGYDESPLPVLYVTDGDGYMGSGDMATTSWKLIDENKVSPHIIVFVSPIDPSNTSINRRNSQFLCNPEYLKFYKQELIPRVDQDYNTIGSRDGRGILGLSFGGLNAMYFALYGSDTFQKIGIQSPAPHPCPTIYNDFEKAGRLPLDIFLSTGTVNDKARDTRRFKSVLEHNGYNFKYIEVSEGHNWKNWKPLLDDVLIYFYGVW